MIGMMKYKRLEKSWLTTSEEAKLFERYAQDFVMTVKVIYLSGLQISRDDKRKTRLKAICIETLLLSHSVQ